METPSRPLDGPFRAIEGGLMTWAGPVLGMASAYLAARWGGAWAAAVASGIGASLIGLAWSRRAARLAELAAYFSRQSRTDALTGLDNDRSFRDRFEALSRSHRSATVSLILVDVDQFKSYNDAHGHPAGDDALRTIASILRGSAPGAGLAYRLGGDEFAILIEGALSESRELAERLRSSIEVHPWPLRPITASFGLASNEGTPCDPSALRACADRALYRSKERGRNRVSDPSREVPSTD